ncbi:MAG: hypothetical protein U9N78_07330 [Actinomycetota bacterium]|nr:hypothetical protein [Actinomycetota bacterium]
MGINESRHDEPAGGVDDSELIVPVNGLVRVEALADPATVNNQRSGTLAQGFVPESGSLDENPFFDRRFDQSVEAPGGAFMNVEETATHCP